MLRTGNPDSSKSHWPYACVQLTVDPRSIKFSIFPSLPRITMTLLIFQGLYIHQISRFSLMLSFSLSTTSPHPIRYFNFLLRRYEKNDKRQKNLSLSLSDGFTFWNTCQVTLNLTTDIDHSVSTSYSSSRYELFRSLYHIAIIWRLKAGFRSWGTGGIWNRHVYSVRYPDLIVSIEKWLGSPVMAVCHSIWQVLRLIG